MDVSINGRYRVRKYKTLVIFHFAVQKSETSISKVNNQSKAWIILLNLLHSWRMCLLNSGQEKSSLGKNLRWYSPIGAWLVIALVALTQRVFEWPKYWSHGPPLIIDGTRGKRLSSHNPRKFFPLWSDAWKDLLHCAEIISQLHFLQKSHDDLQE